MKARTAEKKLNSLKKVDYSGAVKLMQELYFVVWKKRYEVKEEAKRKHLHIPEDLEVAIVRLERKKYEYN